MLKKCGQKNILIVCVYFCSCTNKNSLLLTDRTLRRQRLVRNWVCDEFKPARASHLQQGQRQVHGTHRGDVYKQNNI